MVSVKSLIDAKYLSVCPAADAVAWLKEKKAAVKDHKYVLVADNTDEEAVLASRNDPYLDVALARYGFSVDACKPVYARGDAALRYTFLAHFPYAGYHPIFDGFVLHETAPASAHELCAVMMNPSVTDRAFEDCFERKGAFANLAEEEFQAVLYHASENPRLNTPFDDSILDGFAWYTYHKKFTAAWKLTETIPTTPRWAYTLERLLRNCQPPIDFDPVPVLSRWMFPVEKDGHDIGIGLRSRLAELLEPNEVLLRSPDAALRQSFYRRFNPAIYTKWLQFAEDGETFFDGALYNPHLWQNKETRDALRRLCWSHPDPQSSMDMPRMYNGAAKYMSQNHPGWFV